MIRNPPAPPGPRRDGLYLVLVLVSLAASLGVASVAGYLWIATPPTTTPTGPSRFYAAERSYDFGLVPQAIVSHSFVFENRGAGDLRVWGLTSSCDCTSGHVVIDGVPGPHLGMHTSDPWVGVVPPGTTGTLVAMYDATQMPDRYVGPRELYLQTNDRGTPVVTFTIYVNEGP